MSSDIITVKAAIITLLKADTALQALLSKDTNQNWPIYHGLVQQKIHKPCITVEDVDDPVEVSGLSDSYDGLKSYQWHNPVIQIDCWSSKNAEERDQLQNAVEKCLLKRANQLTLALSGVDLSEPHVTALDEPDAKPPLWRKSLRYLAFFELES